MIHAAIRVFRKSHIDEDIFAVYSKLCDGISDIDAPWGLKNVPTKPLKDVPGWVVNGVSYRQGGAVKAFGISFFNRRRRPDSPDDSILIEFNAERKGLDLRFLFDDVIPMYIKAFDGFYASVEDVDAVVRRGEWLRSLSSEEHAAFRAKFNSYRNSISLIWQVNYWSREQCRNYFGLSPEDVVECLHGRVARADMLQDGAYIVYSYEPMQTSAVERITPELMPLLSGI